MGHHHGSYSLYVCSFRLQRKITLSKSGFEIALQISSHKSCEIKDKTFLSAWREGFFSPQISSDMVMVEASSTTLLSTAITIYRPRSTV